jgi:lipopolysaccharide/colanic/teichoic acid biosynthesis glycosyltransferase
MYKKYFKRIVDFLISLLGLLVLSPLFIIIIIFLFIANNGSPFFFQNRPGKDGVVFKIVKFKTMNDKKDQNGNLCSDEMRLTKIGSFIRKISLDELPQLVNVLKGDMSLIGPRPLLTNYLHLYTEYQNRRHEVKPGITGLAQVNGRNAISWGKKFDYDILYVDTVSFALDLKIIFLTIKKVILKEGINSDNAATIEPFNGNNL